MTDRRDANAIVDRLIAAWNTHDAGAFARCFAADADFTNVFGMHAKGRSAIAAFHAPIFATMFRDSRLTALETRQRALRDDVMALDVRWEMTGARAPDGTPWPSRRGLMSLVALREEDDWSIAVMHNMDLPAEGMAEAQAALQRAHAPRA